jgi:dimethylargininase
VIALTRQISSAIAHCELTHLPRAPIDLDRARGEHREYERALEVCGCTVERLSAGPDLPDSVFIEDTVVVFDELAVLTRPGAPSRRAESAAVEQALVRYRPLRRIEMPGTMDGGDVLVIDRDVYVGASGRTNREGIEQLDAILLPHGYKVHAVAVNGCLHLKSAVTCVGDRVVLINPQWVARDRFAHCLSIDVDSHEPYGANALIIGGRVIYPASFPGTRERLERAGVDLVIVEASELSKAEGAVTCCSVVFKEEAGP